MKRPKELNAGVELCMADHQALPTSNTQLLLIQHPSISANSHHLPLEWSLSVLASLKFVNTEAQPTKVSSPKLHIQCKVKMSGFVPFFFAYIFI